MERVGFEPTYVLKRADLQSAAFNLSTISPEKYNYFTYISFYIIY